MRPPNVSLIQNDEISPVNMMHIPNMLSQRSLIGEFLPTQRAVVVFFVGV